MAKNLTQKQQKAINKVRETMEAYPLGISFSELVQKTLLSQISVQHALSYLGASEGMDGLWHLPFQNTGSMWKDADKDIGTDNEHESIAPQPDWTTAPGWANWWAVDADGEANYFELEPSIYSFPHPCWDLENCLRQYHTTYQNPFENWGNSLQKRPTESSTSQATETAPVADDSEMAEEVAEVSQATVKQTHIMDEAKNAEHEKLIMPKKARNKPFTPNPIMGYQVQKGKAKIFLDRRATSKTLTLSLDDLKELVNAVEKSERVA